MKSKILQVRIREILSLLSTPSMISIRLRLRNSSLVEICSRVGNASSDEIERLRESFLLNHRFFQAINEKMVKIRGRRASLEGWPELVYVLSRLVRPKVVIETGIFDGISTTAILQSLQDNNQGMLASIDLPAYTVIEGSTHKMKETTLPPGLKPGWVIPDYLNARHRIFLGDSQELLPKVLKELGPVDIFLHDSLHTFDHQWFEYQTVWPHLKKGGLLLSDDVLWTSAFHKFCKEKDRDYKVFNGFGVVVK